MKTYATLTASALIVASTMNSASALKQYCDGLPNSKTACGKVTGHLNGETTTNNKFAAAFAISGFKWTEEFCKDKYAADPSITNGAAFGDPCCSWKLGDTPEHVVDKVVDGSKTTTGTVCKSGSGSAKGEISKTTPSAETNTKGETPETKQSTETNTKGETPETTPSAETNTKGETPETTPSAETNTKGETSEATKGATEAKAGSPPPASAGGGCAAKNARKLRF